jgi:uncharacterized protein (DUF2141 family)
MLCDHSTPQIHLNRLRAATRAGICRARSLHPASSTAAKSVLALPLVCALSTPVGAADLTVVVQNVRSGEGQVMLGVFDNASSFPKNVARGLQAAAASRDASGRVTLVVRNLPSGSYAVSAYHDLDANGRLNSNLLGLPSEPYGFSNNARGTLGPPSFQAAAFVVPEEGLTIELRVQQ